MGKEVLADFGQGNLSCPLGTPPGPKTQPNKRGCLGPKVGKGCAKALPKLLEMSSGRHKPTVCQVLPHLGITPCHISEVPDSICFPASRATVNKLRLDSGAGGPACSHPDPSASVHPAPRSRASGGPLCFSDLSLRLSRN